MKEKRVFEKVRILGIADKGKAIGKDEAGRVVLVNDVVPGDVVDVEITRKKQNYWHGKPYRFVTYSDERVEPLCKHFEDCGGCKWQNLSYSVQLHHKEIVVRDAFERISKIKHAVYRPIIGVEDPYYYRNKLEYTFSNRKWITRKELPAINSNQIEYAAGFHPAGFFNKVVDIETCHLQKGDSNAIRNYIKEYCKARQLAFYDIMQHNGWLRNVIVRNSMTGEQMVIVSFSHENKLEREYLLKSLMDTFPQITTLFYVFNNSKNPDLSDAVCHLYSGPGYIIEEIGQFKYKIGPQSFFQTNSFQTKILFDVIRGFACLKGNEIIWDLYSGIGAITLYLAVRCKMAFGFEEVPEAVTFSWENARINEIGNVTFLQGDVKELLKTVSELKDNKPDVIITDPPRIGMHREVIDHIKMSGAERIIYVSCNPATQARDIGLISDDYRLVASQPVDMFPHTSHVENVALLEKK